MKRDKENKLSKSCDTNNEKYLNSHKKQVKKCEKLENVVSVDKHGDHCCCSDLDRERKMHIHEEERACRKKKADHGDSGRDHGRAHVHEKHKCGCHHDHGHGEHGCECGHDHGHDHGHGECGCGCDHEHGERLSFFTVLPYVIGAILLVIAFLSEFSVIADWIVIPVAAVVYLYFGRDAWVGAFRGIRHGKIFTEFTLMCVATVGAAALLEFADAAAVMYLYSLGEMIQGAAYRKSRENISELIEITEDYINKEENRTIRRVAASEAKVDDIVVVRVGERISVDGVVVEGTGFADTSAITGESTPRELVVGTECLSGSVLVAGAVCLRVTEKYENSTANKLKEAVARAAKQKARTEKRIGKFAAVFTPCAFAVAVLLFVGGWFLWGDIARALKTALVVLVISCPCSLVLSVPLAYFSGIGKAAARGIVFRGGEVIDNAAAVGTVVFDKTGTLTSATLDFDSVWLPKNSPLTKLQLLDISRCALAKSPHAAAQSFCEAYEAKIPHTVDRVNNIGGRGLVCTVDGKLCAFGNKALMADQGISVDFSRGTMIYVAVDGELCGALLFRSKIKPDTLSEIAKLRRNRVERIAIMSGDTAASVAETSDALGIAEHYAELKPDEKLTQFEYIYNEEKKRDRKRTVAFCGDGLNDSATIARADVGIAMGSGSAVTVECADVVIADDSIARVNDMLFIAKSTTRVANQNIALSLGIKLAVVLIGAFLSPSLELAVVADVGAAIVTVLNAMRAGNVH